MTKFKAIVCTLLLAILIAGAFYGSTFVPTSASGINLTILIVTCASLFAYVDGISKFYKWLMKQ